MTRVDNFFVKTDIILDYVPVVSTATNLIDLFQKTVVFPFVSDEDIAASHYFKYINEKDAFRCLTLLVPVIGNIAVLFYDLSMNPEFMLEAIREMGYVVLQFAHSQLTSNKEFMLAAVKIDGGCLSYASNRLKDDIEVVNEAAEQNIWALLFASKKLMNNSSFVVRLVVKKDLRAFAFASPRLRNDDHFVMEIIQNIEPKNVSEVIACLDEDMRNNQNLMLSAIEKKWECFLSASKLLLQNPDFIVEAIKRNPLLADFFLKFSFEDRIDLWNDIFNRIKKDPNIRSEMKERFLESHKSRGLAI